MQVSEDVGTRSNIYNEHVVNSGREIALVVSRIVQELANRNATTNHMRTVVMYVTYSNPSRLLSRTLRISIISEPYT